MDCLSRLLVHGIGSVGCWWLQMHSGLTHTHYLLPTASMAADWTSASLSGDDVRKAIGMP